MIYEDQEKNDTSQDNGDWDTDEYPQIENLLFGEYTQLVKDELEKIL